jgi:hypothetical protein
MKLRPDENLVYKTRPHWIVFGWAVWPASLAGRLFAATNYARNVADAHMWLNLTWTFCLFTAIVVILAQFYRWSSRLLLTDRRVILRNGILRQRSMEFHLHNVELIHPCWSFRSWAGYLITGRLPCGGSGVAVISLSESQSANVFVN